MSGLLSLAGSRLRILCQRLLARMGLRDDAFLVLISVIVGVITSAAAVGFHELTLLLRQVLYHDFGPDLYGSYIWLLIAWPALGGLVVGVLSRHVFHAREGHGVIDVIESVVRSRGFVPARSAIEKICTSAVTLGTGGSTGAEGPIVQIGAAISSGVGTVFSISRHHMPVVVGCGCAAGISAIFNAPIGGLLFTLEVILHDFSLRTLTPLVVASVVANVTTQAIYRVMHHMSSQVGLYDSIFHVPTWVRESHSDVFWPHLPTFAVLGALCGMVAVLLTKSMFWSEQWFANRKTWPATIRPAIGGAMLGAIGVLYVLAYRKAAGELKPIAFEHYALPAFFSDGYGAIQVMLGPEFYAGHGLWFLLVLLFVWLIAKVAATCVTLGSGGSGGVIAPALFLGATVGGILGLSLQHLGMFSVVRPELYALLGMAGVLAAVVHAPLASILILMEITGDSTLVLPGMLTAVLATSVARIILPDSIYTYTLRQRGVPVGTANDLILLRRLSMEQVELAPANVVPAAEPIERVLSAVANGAEANFVAVDESGDYVGMVADDDLRAALLDRDAVPLLLVRDVMRADLAPVRTTDDLASVMDRFAATDCEYLPVSVAKRPNKVVGVVSRSSLMKRYRMAVNEEG